MASIGPAWLILPRNVAPVIDGIAMQDPGVRATATVILNAGQPVAVTLKQPPSPNTSGVIITQSGIAPKFEPPPQGTQQKGYASVLWSAHDENEDDLRFAVYYRGENERDWKLLKDKLEQKFYSWDTTSFADGAYYLKIVATDAPSNSPSMALSTERISERFEVDNTPPTIEHLEAGVARQSQRQRKILRPRLRQQRRTRPIQHRRWRLAAAATR